MNDEVRTLATLIRHQGHLRANLSRLIHDLELRSALHDSSKLSLDEFEGFAEVNRVAREHPIGSPRYEASLRDAECIHLHFSRNSHHPEFHGAVFEMGWLDLIEMVMDWKAATDTYGTNTLRGSLDYQRERHGFSDEQWWLIEQVVDFLDPQ